MTEPEATSPVDEDEQLEALSAPPQLPPRRGSDLVSGIGLTPEEILGAMGPDRLEVVVPHWLDATVTSRYPRVLHVAGPGDRGRDVVAHLDPVAPDPWDNYQCKQYKNQLGLAEIVPEIGKLVFWVSRKAYTNPQRYVFVCPKGITPAAWNTLQDHEALRAHMVDRWDKNATCRTLCPYGDIREHLAGFAFPAFGAAEETEIVRGLKDSPMFPVLFGGGLTKPRPDDQEPPEEIDADEIGYITRLLEAYADHEPDASIVSPDDALGHETFGRNLRVSRRAFYCAQSLHRFSLEVLVSPDKYESLRDELHDGIIPKLEQAFGSGFARMLAVTDHATLVQLSDHPLRPYVRPRDRIGMCHQLANEGHVRWKVKD